jgi:putative ABC transport system permease protein
MAESFRSSVVTALTAAVRADVVVTSVHVTSGYVEAPMDEELLQHLEAIPGVEAIVGAHVVEWPHAGRRVAIEAVDARYFTSEAFGRWPLGVERIPGVWERVARGEAAIASTNFLHNFATRVGERIVLSTPSGPLALVIGGATAAFESPAGTLQMSREVFRRYWRDGQVNRVGLRVAPGADVATVRAAIARDLAPRYDLRVLSAGELVGYYADQVGRAFAPLHVLAATVLVVTLLGVADTLLAAALGRRRELGVARAIGAGRASLVRTVFVEALAMGVLGFALALASGLGLAALWVRETLPHLLGWMLELHLPYRELPLLALITLTVAGVAAVLPARYVARLEPGVALREE